MRKTVFSLLKFSFVGVILTLPVSAQFPEDAFRLSSIGLGTGARSLGMGMAYTGIANDFSATYWNPAGLGQIGMSEMSLGLAHQSFGNTSTFLDNQKSLNNSATSLNAFGLVYPFPTSRGSLVFAAGYSRVNDFTTALSFDGFNPVSSIIPTLNFDLAYQLYLKDSVGSTPLIDSLRQRGKVLEGGGLNNWTFAGAIEAAKQVYLGISLNVISGSYTYNREYLETDMFNKYSVARFDTEYAFTRLHLINTIDGSITGFTARFGMLYKFNSGARFGLNIKIPSFFYVQENFSSDGTSLFDVPDVQGLSSYNYRIDGKTDYDVTSPFVFSAGASIPLGNLLLAGDVEYTDWTQMEFSNADPLIEQYNSDIKELFRPTATMRVGAEYEFNEFRLRGGFAYLPSPFRDDPSSFAQKFVTGGAGFLLGNVVALDLAYLYGFWDTFHVNYDAGPQTLENIRTHTFLATVSFRF